ncbi:MAG: glycosyltransferase family 4 protein [Beijerinckiaceae bacterium]|nr:glycosyltransferase family 4 protein [Beijerinckiaceae bacterium]
MKRLAYVLAEFPVLSETFVGNEIRAMQRQGHAVLPLIMRRGAGMAQPEDVGLADRSTCLRDLPRGPQAAFRPAPRALARGLGFAFRQKRLPRASLVYQGWRIANWLRRERIDHVHAHFAGGGAAHAILGARLAGVSVSFVCHGHDVYAEAEDLPEKLAAADRVIAVCGDLAEDLRRTEPACNLRIVPCGIDPERYAYRPKAHSNGRLLFVGRLVPQKGLEDLFAALGRMPAAQRPGLDLVGDGPLRPMLEAEAGRLDGGPEAIRFLGAQTASWYAGNGPDYLALVAPFKTAPDGARDTGPLVVKEAMAMGLPVISTAYMGVKEMILPDMGTLVAPGDVDALAEAITRIGALPEAARLGQLEAARRHVVRAFSLDQCAARLSATFETLDLP